jgi:hypothetical protein
MASIFKEYRTTAIACPNTSFKLKVQSSLLCAILVLERQFGASD